jgi:hypothetical protein
MKVLLINGSPRKAGNTFRALTEVANTLESLGVDSEIVHIGPVAVQGCIACFRCKGLGRCVFNDRPYVEIREKLETFSKNQLGIWAIQYSREKLIELAEEAVNLGRTKWEDRDVQYGNLFDSVAAFKEAIFYLETVNPKPPCANAAHKGLEQSEAELVRRYRDQRFLADRAINLQRWEDARKELSVLMELVPDRNDERNREASAKLIDVEKRMKKGGK